MSKRDDISRPFKHINKHRQKRNRSDICQALAIPSLGNRNNIFFFTLTRNYSDNTFLGKHFLILVMFCN